MIKMYEHFHSHVITNRNQHYQLKLNIPNNGARGVQTNSYYSTVKVWNELAKIVKNAKNINMF